MKRPRDLDDEGLIVLRYAIELWIAESRFDVGLTQEETINGIVSLMDKGLVELICDEDGFSVDFINAHMTPKWMQ